MVNHSISMVPMSEYIIVIVGLISEETEIFDISLEDMIDENGDAYQLLAIETNDVLSDELENILDGMSNVIAVTLNVGFDSKGWEQVYE